MAVHVLVEPKSNTSIAGPDRGGTVLDYYFADPFQTSLHGRLDIPKFPADSPAFIVVGWSAETNVKPGSISYQAAQVWGAIASTLYYILELKTDPRYVYRWSNALTLVAIPRAGNQLNAYYDRASLRFFWGKDSKTKKAIYTCDAVGICAHELGHAILDSMRPDLWDVAILEFFSFHEAFGDILAIASVLQHDVVIDQMLTETTKTGEAPDLWQSNVASRLAEQLGHAVYYSSNMVIGASRYLRNAFNDFKYADPLTLGFGSSDKVLTLEPHNFSRVMSGAWYEGLCRIFTLLRKKNSAEHPDLRSLVKSARDLMTSTLLDAVLIAESRLTLFHEIARCMILALQNKKLIEEAAVLKGVFERRQLLHPLAPLPQTKLVATDCDVNGSLKLEIRTGQLREITVQVPQRGYAKDAVELRNALQASVQSFLTYIQDQHLMGDQYDDNMFVITTEGALRRNYICSSFRAEPCENEPLLPLGNLVQG